MLNCPVLTEKLRQIKQKICLLKMNLKSSKLLIRTISLAKVILKKIEHNIISIDKQVF